MGQHLGQGQKACPTPPPLLGQETKAVQASGASVSLTGLEWLPGPPDSDGPAFETWWSAFDLHHLCHLHAVRIVAAGKRVVAIFSAYLEPELVAYISALLDDARSYLAAHRDKLPNLTPAEAATAINEIMRLHKGLRFCRGDDGSRWPLYPTTWTAGQKATVQSLWLVAGDALDADSFERVEPCKSSATPGSKRPGRSSDRSNRR